MGDDNISKEKIKSGKRQNRKKMLVVIAAVLIVAGGVGGFILYEKLKSPLLSTSQVSSVVGGKWISNPSNSSSNITSDSSSFNSTLAVGMTGGNAENLTNGNESIIIGYITYKNNYYSEHSYTNVINLFSALLNPQTGNLGSATYSYFNINISTYYTGGFFNVTVPGTHMSSLIAQNNNDLILIMGFNINFSQNQAKTLLQDQVSDMQSV
jgi:hypothetical protein